MRLPEHPPARVVRWWVFDVLVALLVVVSSTAVWITTDASITWPAILVMIATAAPLIVRRVWPTAVLLWVFLLTSVTALWDQQLASGFALTVALYSVAAWGSRKTAIGAAVVLEICVLVAVVPLAGANWWSELGFLTGLFLAAVGLGLYSSTRRAYLQELRERATRLEREVEQINELAALTERARISREMHDIVAHNLTVMVALSDGAAATAHHHPDRAADVMRTVSATGRQALAETRRLLGVVNHEEPDERHPLPELGDVNTLLDGIRAAGLPVSFVIQGAPVTLSPGLQLTVYRLIQESLTNTFKHAGAGARATVRVQYLPGELLIDVDDDGAGSSTPPSTSPGRGLAGMRERVNAYGGTVQCGPRYPAGWRVSVQLRLDDQAGP